MTLIPPRKTPTGNVKTTWRQRNITCVNLGTYTSWNVSLLFNGVMCLHVPLALQSLCELVERKCVIRSRSPRVGLVFYRSNLWRLWIGHVLWLAAEYLWPRHVPKKLCFSVYLAEQRIQQQEVHKSDINRHLLRLLVDCRVCCSHAPTLRLWISL